MLGSILTAIVGVVHLGIMVLEIFFWTSPRSRKAFNMSVEFAASTKVMAANQGLYNGFLAAGLFWGAWLGADGRLVSSFFLACVAVAGVFGALTAARRIVFVQTIPALVALIAVHFG